MCSVDLLIRQITKLNQPTPGAFWKINTHAEGKPVICAKPGVRPASFVDIHPDGQRTRNSAKQRSVLKHICLAIPDICRIVKCKLPLIERCRRRQLLERNLNVRRHLDVRHLLRGHHSVEPSQVR